MSSMPLSVLAERDLKPLDGEGGKPMPEDVFDMTFAEIQVLGPEDWLDKIKQWIQKVGEELGEFEVDSISITIAAPPSATITYTKPRAGIDAIPAS